MVLAATLTLVFAGGSTPKLADALAGAHHAPVAILATGVGALEPLSTETDDPFTFGNRVYRLAKIRAPKDGTGYAPAGWPAYMRPVSKFFRDGGPWQGVHFDTWRVTRKKDQIAVDRGGSGYLRVADLERVDLGKPVKVPEFYGRALVAVSSGTWQSRTFLASIAQAIGAKLVESADAFEFKLNPKEFRKRLSEAMTEEIERLEKAQFDEVHTAQAQLIRATVEALTDAQIETFFQAGHQTPALEVAPGSALALRCMRYLSAYAKRADIAGMDPPRFRALVERMDLSKGIRVTFNPHEISVGIRANDKQVPGGALEL